MSIARFAGHDGTAYVGSVVTAISADTTVDATFAATCAISVDIDGLIAACAGWACGAIVVHDPETSAAEVAVIGDAAVLVEVSDGVRTLQSSLGWTRHSVGDTRFVTLLTDPKAARDDVEALHHVEAGIVPASLLTRRVASIPADEADPFEAMFGHTVHRSVEHAAMRPDAADGAHADPLGVLVFESGERVLVDRTIVLGRRPLAVSDQRDCRPRLVRVSSAGVSRQHAVVRVERWSATIDDLGSSNGTRITVPGRPAKTLVPGMPADLVPGAIVELGGDVSFVVEAVA